jgi:hypothetical protein
MEKDKDEDKEELLADRIDLTNDKSLIEENSEAHTPELDGPATEEEAEKLLAAQTEIDLSEHTFTSRDLQKAVAENKQGDEKPLEKSSS